MEKIKKKNVFRGWLNPVIDLPTGSFTTKIIKIDNKKLYPTDVEVKITVEWEEVRKLGYRRGELSPKPKKEEL